MKTLKRLNVDLLQDVTALTEKEMIAITGGGYSFCSAYCSSGSVVQGAASCYELSRSCPPGDLSWCDGCNDY